MIGLPNGLPGVFGIRSDLISHASARDGSIILAHLTLVKALLPFISLFSILKPKPLLSFELQYLIPFIGWEIVLRRSTGNLNLPLSDACQRVR